MQANQFMILWATSDSQTTGKIIQQTMDFFSHKSLDKGSYKLTLTLRLILFFKKSCDFLIFLFSLFCYICRIVNCKLCSMCCFRVESLTYSASSKLWKLSTVLSKKMWHYELYHTVTIVSLGDFAQLQLVCWTWGIPKYQAGPPCEVAEREGSRGPLPV